MTVTVLDGSTCSTVTYSKNATQRLYWRIFWLLQILQPYSSILRLVPDSNHWRTHLVNSIKSERNTTKAHYPVKINSLILHVFNKLGLCNTTLTFQSFWYYLISWNVLWSAACPECQCWIIKLTTSITKSLIVLVGVLLWNSRSVC